VPIAKPSAAINMRIHFAFDKRADGKLQWNRIDGKVAMPDVTANIQGMQ